MAADPVVTTRKKKQTVKKLRYELKSVAACKNGVYSDIVIPVPRMSWGGNCKSATGRLNSIQGRV